MDVALSVGVGADEAEYRGRLVVSSLCRGRWAEWSVVDAVYVRRKRKKEEKGRNGPGTGWRCWWLECRNRALQMQ